MERKLREMGKRKEKYINKEEGCEVWEEGRKK